jgi:hypothetical protein
MKGQTSEARRQRSAGTRAAADTRPCAVCGMACGGVYVAHGMTGRVHLDCASVLMAREMRTAVSRRDAETRRG